MTEKCVQNNLFWVVILRKKQENWQKQAAFWLKSAKSDTYLSPFKISATMQTYYNLASYNAGGRFADILAKTYWKEFQLFSGIRI